jgi:lactase-phlorizin hydrolase
MIVNSLHRSKFGLYYVDYNDPERTRKPKKSASFMSNVTRTRRIPHDYQFATRKLENLEGM